MFFNRSKDDAPKAVHDAGLSKWYGGLSDQDRVKLERYLPKADPSSPQDFFMSVIKAADEDDNYRFAASLKDVALGSVRDDYGRFKMGEVLIDPLIGAGMSDDAKALCMAGIDMFPEIKDKLVSENGGIPKHLECRNRAIDILVGVESDYDGANALLDRYLEMGLIDAEEHSLRRQSLKIHRLQRTFDCVYTVQPKQ